jgi:hypothetical protein
VAAQIEDRSDEAGEGGACDVQQHARIVAEKGGERARSDICAIQRVFMSSPSAE